MKKRLKLNLQRRGFWLVKLFNNVTEDDLYKFGYSSEEIEALGELFLELKDKVEYIEMMEG